MNKGSDVCDYLNNNISKDLQLNYVTMLLKLKFNGKSQVYALESFNLEKSRFQKRSAIVNVHQKIRDYTI